LLKKAEQKSENIFFMSSAVPPIAKGLHRAREDYDTICRRALEDYEIQVYRALADGLDWYYHHYPWRRESFIELRCNVLDDIKELCRRGEWRDAGLIALFDNNFDIIMQRHLLRGIPSFSCLLQECVRVQEGKQGCPPSRGVMYYFDLVDRRQEMYRKREREEDEWSSQREEAATAKQARWSDDGDRDREGGDE